MDYEAQKSIKGRSGFDNLVDEQQAHVIAFPDRPFHNFRASR